jgi:HSP20 family protein
MNLYDAGDHYLLAVPVPGMSPSEIDLSITGETLTLRGERRRPEGVSDESYRRQERPFGRWTRTVTLPDRVEGSQVSASYALGVLTVTLPKAESARPRQITVSAAG